MGLNRAYREKFGFPFLYAVKGSDKAAILEALERRLNSSREIEFPEALRQVYRIARFRLESIIEGKKGPMHQFASGWKKSYYGKGDVTVYRLNRDPGQGALFGAHLLILISLTSFFPPYT